MRRYTRRSQPRPGGTKALLHTSAAAASEQSIQLSRAHVRNLQDSLLRAQVEQEIWIDGISSAVQAAKAYEIEIRLQAQEEARLHVERNRQEIQRVHEERLAEQRARAAEWQEQQRQIAERSRLEREADERRLREAEAAAEQARQEAERRRIERLRNCTVCMDDNDLDMMIQTPCQHWYCGTCLNDGFRTALNSRTPFRCCQQDVPVDLIAAALPDDFTARYAMMVLESNTPNPTYCSNVQCAVFIPPANYHGPDSARCLQCGTDTCRHCRTRSHAGRGCTNDPATEQVRRLAVEVGWKQCPACGTMVEKNAGCQHMTCPPPCGHEFCWVCTGPWPRCRCRQ